MPGYKPLKFTYEGEDKIKGLCGCKYNKIEKGPFCDGQHKKLDWWIKQSFIWWKECDWRED